MNSIWTTPQHRANRRAMRPRPIPILLLVVLALALAACGASREKTLNTSATVLAAAYQGWFAWDDIQQDEIIDRATSHEQGQAALAEYRRTRQAPIVKAFVVACLAVIAAARQSDDESLGSALAAVGEFGKRVDEAMKGGAQ